MTREEKLQQFAEQYTKGLYLDRHNLIQMVKAGAEWADQHPQWIPVEERLPDDIGGFSMEVYVYCAERLAGRYGIAIYNHISNCWMSEYSDDEITHWMPIVPPRKEDKE